MLSKLSPAGAATPQIRLRSGLVGGQTTSQSNGGTWFNGVFYPDYSGTCNPATTPTTPPTSGQAGTWFNGVFYPDFSGTCTTSTTTTG